MAEWLYEEGIGENRAAFIEGGTILEAAIELPGCARLGAVRPAQLRQILAEGRRGLVLLDNGQEAIIEPVPSGLHEGAAFRAEVVRETIPEPGRAKLPKVSASESPLGEGASLRDRIGRHVRLSPVGPDRLEEAGWSELLEEARSGEIAFPGGALRMSLTPAMTLFDVDGDLPAAKLAEAGAAAAALAIRRLGISGSIGLDLPTLAERTSRQAAAATVDAILPQPFERTAVNGFGFLQIIRRRQRPSIPEQLHSDPVGAAARVLLRRAERCGGQGKLTIRAAPSLIDRLSNEADWLDRLRQRIGADLCLQPQAELSISAGHVQRESL